MSQSSFKEVSLTISDLPHGMGATIQQRLPMLLDTPFIIPTLTAKCMESISGSNVENACIVFAVGCVHHKSANRGVPKGVSKGVPVEWLMEYFRSVLALRKLGAKDDQLYCLICYEIAGESELKNEQERRMVLEIAGWHFAIIQQINEVAEKLNLPKIKPILDGVLRQQEKGLYWRWAQEILARHKGPKRVKTTRYVDYQTTLMLAFYLYLCAERKRLKKLLPRNTRVGKICLIKSGWSTVPSQFEIDERHRDADQLRLFEVDSEVEGGLCEALSDYPLRLVQKETGARLRIGYVYGAAPAGLSANVCCPYTAKDASRLFLQSTDDDPTELLATYLPDVTKGMNAVRVERVQRCAESLLGLTMLVEEVIPGFFGAEDDSLWKSVYNAEKADAVAQSHHTLALKGEAQAKIARPRAAKLLRTFGPTQSRKDRAFEEIAATINASGENVEIPAVVTR